MANYYNLVGYKHTGLNTKNRPAHRSFFNQNWFKDDNNYFEMKGIAIKRDDPQGLTYIDLPGSVKDRDGSQFNDPNTTGSLGPGGPFYAWEQVDYIRLTRTGYPGDKDFVDITEHIDAPWNAPANHELFVCYYFVVGLKPLARNMTRLFLQFDAWTSCGCSDELTIINGFKTRGPITDAEDAASYNIAPEQIGLIEPAVVVGHQIVADVSGTDNPLNVIVSTTDLTQYNNLTSNVDAWIASATGETELQFAFPKVKSAKSNGSIGLLEPGATTKTFFLKDKEIYNSDNDNVQYNLSFLYSTGQLQLQNSYSIPDFYIEYKNTEPNGIITGLRNKVYDMPLTIKKDIGSYPRKADYLFGQEVLYSTITGAQNIQPFYEIENDNVYIWSILSPNGSPYARFKKIKEHPYLYDQTIQGAQWMTKAIILEGASGSLQNQLNAAFSMRTQARAEAQSEVNRNFQVSRNLINDAALAANIGLDAAEIAGSGFSLKNIGEGGEQTFKALRQGVSDTQQALLAGADQIQQVYNYDFERQALAQSRNQINANLGMQNFSAPYTNFMPDINRQAFGINGFGVYIINTSQKDRQRLKNYFLRYGYSGQYKELTWDNVFVKRYVNYIEAEAPQFDHKWMPWRVLNEIADMFYNGVFLWDTMPRFNVFSNNPDR